MAKTILKACAVFLFLTFFITSAVNAFEGVVVSVADGDTITVEHNGTTQKVRLNGIDCPEKSQRYGKTAEKFTSKLVLGKTVKIKENGKDKYGRIIADVILEDGTVLNEELVRNGLAWWYQKYSNDLKLKQLEKQARSRAIGLWTEMTPTPPWEYRKSGGFTYSSIPLGSPTTNKGGPGSGSTEDRTILTGPRGGRYYMNKNGNKTYVKR